MSGSALDKFAKGGGGGDEERDDPQGPGMGGPNRPHEASLAAETNDGRLWVIPYGHFIPCDAGAAGGKDWSLRFWVGDDVYDLVVESDGGERARGIAMCVIRHKQLTLRGKGCIKSVEVRKVE